MGICVICYHDRDRVVDSAQWDILCQRSNRAQYWGGVRPVRKQRSGRKSPEEASRQNRTQVG